MAYEKIISRVEAIRVRPGVRQRIRVYRKDIKDGEI